MKIHEWSMLDRHFADFIVRQSGESSCLTGVVAGLLSNAAGQGHICLNLSDFAGSDMMIDGRPFTAPEIDAMRDALLSNPTVGQPGDFKPLILDSQNRLYLHRYWKYENDLVRVIRDKADQVCDEPDEEILRDGLKRLFQDACIDSPDWQKVAAVAALRKRFLVVSGGPGTGKTSIVVKIIALLLEQQKGAPLSVALAAPTGKSAMRLREALIAMKDSIDCDEAVKRRIPETVSTLHRLLGASSGPGRFRHSGKNPLLHDVVIVDEASMVPLPLAARLAGALKPEARLILIGDRNQLASVEAGAVLGDICGGGRDEVYTREFCQWYENLTGQRLPIAPAGEQSFPLADCLVVLKRNYRFAAQSGIGAAAKAVNEGNGAEALRILEDASYPDIAWRELPAYDRIRKVLRDEVVDGYGPYLAAKTPREALERFDQFRMLCVLQNGPYGAAAFNDLIERILAGSGAIDPSERWYRGRPVMITLNDYNMKLYNGDIGITFPDPDDVGRLCVFFPAADGGVRKVSPVRLPGHETAYAMTVHKSQGSEFDTLTIILPSGDSPLLTRELLYTGMTRGRSRVMIRGDKQWIEAAASRRIQRASGLQDALWPE
ncbi:MAG TPA: exodeoxyribonuclease V subunit alpha [Smithellaceae bacterium]|nr:exodeoxyribonuclease V subunit alpha [Smithellaceae bacterium]